MSGPHLPGKEDTTPLFPSEPAACHTIVFIDSYHSVRSPEAEAITRTIYPGRWDPASAGIAPSGLNWYTVRILSEIGFTMPAYRPRSLAAFGETDRDYSITFCNHARNTCCRSPPNARNYLHQHFPAREGLGIPEREALTQFRRITNTILRGCIRKYGTENRVNDSRIPAGETVHEDNVSLHSIMYPQQPHHPRENSIKYWIIYIL